MQGPGFWSLVRELNFEDEVGVFQDKSQEQEDFRKKEMKWQDIACNNKHLFWELWVFFACRAYGGGPTLPWPPYLISFILGLEQGEDLKSFVF